MKTQVLIALAAGLFLSAMSASGHHNGGFFFDASKKVTVEGVVKNVMFVYPHIAILLEVENEAGELEEWSAEASNPRGMIQRGWSPDTVKVGDAVVMTGNASRQGKRAMELETILRPSDGWTFGQRPSQQYTPETFEQRSRDNR